MSKNSSGNKRKSGAEAPIHMQLVQMATAGWVSMVIYAAALFGLADHLADGPADSKELARLTGTHPPSLYRLMRTLAGLGILTEETPGRFSLTPLGEALKSDAPGCARSCILTFGSSAMQAAVQEFPYSIRTGKTGFEKAHGMPIFEWLGRQPKEAVLFSETMIAVHGDEPMAVAEAYDFSGLKTLVDVGGSSGNLLAAVLARYPEARGTLFDLPEIREKAESFIRSRQLADRITIESGSFFESAPEGGDAYLLSHIIHDWSEEQCLTILAHCRRAMKPGGRLLIIEMVVPDGNEPHPSKMLDMIMLVLPGGRERTKEEYRVLLEKAGFRLQRVVPTASAVSVVEAFPV